MKKTSSVDYFHVCKNDGDETKPLDLSVLFKKLIDLTLIFHII